MKTQKFDYRLLLLIPTAVLVVSISILIYNFSTTGEWFLLSFELKGGTLITLNNVHRADVEKAKNEIPVMKGALIRSMRGVSSESVMIEMSSGVNSTELLKELEKRGINTEQSSVSVFEPSISRTFWEQARLALVFAFILMGIIVFLIFKTFVPSVAVILSAFSDIVVTLAAMQIIGIELSLASLAALLMLIGYSVDTDILLTTRVLKRGGEINERLKSAFKTGITMSVTTISVMLVLYISSISLLLSQIASVLLIGLVVDLINTWIQNAVIIRWYAERLRA